MKWELVYRVGNRCYSKLFASYRAAEVFRAEKTSAAWWDIRPIS